MWKPLDSLFNLFWVEWNVNTCSCSWQVFPLHAPNSSVPMKIRIYRIWNCRPELLLNKSKAYWLTYKSLLQWERPSLPMNNTNNYLNANKKLMVAFNTLMIFRVYIKLNSLKSVLPQMLTMVFGCTMTWFRTTTAM